MEISGKIVVVLPAVGGTSKTTGNEWQSQTYVIETDGQYPKRCAFEVFGTEKIIELNVQLNEVCKVYFDIDAHEWNGRWFNSVRAWKVEHAGDAQSQPSNTGQTTIQATPFPPQVDAQGKPKQPVQMIEGNDQLPF